MSIYTFLDGKIINACQNFVSEKISVTDASEMFGSFGDQIRSLEDQRLKDLLESIASTFDIFWYAMAMDVEETERGYIRIREEMLPYVDKIEKLIIRGSEDGAPVTEEERAKWWKMQKQREREEFYKLNGYYKDEEQ